MALEDLRYCTVVRRIVGTDEFHAGVFTSRACEGCCQISPWMEDIVRASLVADRDRAQHHLELLARRPETVTRSGKSI